MITAWLLANWRSLCDTHQHRKLANGDVVVMAAQVFHLAQINIARMLAPLDDPVMVGFVARLDEINAVADHSPGFVWRFQTESGNATEVRPYDDDRILVNFSIWESVEHLQQYVYRSQHTDVLRQRKQWFIRAEQATTALWWIPVGHIPSVEEAKSRLDYLCQHGESVYAFSFKNIFPVPDQPLL